MMTWATSSCATAATVRICAAKRTKGTYEHTQKCLVGNGSGVYARVFRLCDRLRLDKGWGRTTCGNRQSSAGRRTGPQPADRPTSRIRSTGELLGERENHPD